MALHARVQPGMQDFARNSAGLRTLSVLFKSGQSRCALRLRNDHYTDMSASERIGYPL
jgi:hypothetical protein